MKKLKVVVFILIAAVIAVTVAICVAVVNQEKSVRYVYRDDTQADKDNKDNVCNILFLGNDREAGLCDVIMLIGINRTTGSVTVAQIPRDTYAAYTENSYKKLNGAYASLGSADAMAEFLGESFGITIDHYVCIGLDTLSNIVDAIGGVDVELPCDMQYDDSTQGLHINMKKGVQHLDGKLAEQFVRFRSAYANGDLGRIDAQKLFMSALFKKLADDFSPVMAAKITAAADGVETDVSVSKLFAIGSDVLDMKSDNIVMLTLAGEQAIATQSGASYFVLSKSACAEIMENYFGAEREFDAEQRFLNERYDTFKDIYFGYTEYKAFSVNDVSSEALDMQIK